MSRAFYYFSMLNSRARIVAIYLGVTLLWWLLFRLSAFSMNENQMVSWFLPAALSFTLLTHFGTKVLPCIFLASLLSLQFEYGVLKTAAPFGLSPSVYQAALAASIHSFATYLISWLLRKVIKQRIDPALPSHFFATFIGALVLSMFSVGTLTFAVFSQFGFSEEDARTFFFHQSLAHFTGIICLGPLLSHWIDRFKLHIWLNQPSHVDLSRKRYRALDGNFWLLLLAAAVLLPLIDFILFRAGGAHFVLPMTGITIIMLSAFLGLFYSQYALSLTIFTLSSIMIYATQSGESEWLGQLQQMLPVVAAASFGYMFLPFLQQRNQMLLYLVNTDPLTGINNRYFLFKQGELELLRARRYGRPLSLLMIDLDLFKSINDTYGHIAGDEVLEQFSARCKKLLRDDSMLCRYGGEEFVILLPEANMESALLVYERIRNSLVKTPIHYQHFKLNITISVGIAEIQEADNQLQDLISRADDKLYQAKREGRDAVRF